MLAVMPEAAKAGAAQPPLQACCRAGALRLSAQNLLAAV